MDRMNITDSFYSFSRTERKKVNSKTNPKTLSSYNKHFDWWATTIARIMWLRIIEIVFVVLRLRRYWKTIIAINSRWTDDVVLGLIRFYVWSIYKFTILTKRLYGFSNYERPDIISDTNRILLLLLLFLRTKITFEVIFLWIFDISTHDLYLYDCIPRN